MLRMAADIMCVISVHNYEIHEYWIWRGAAEMTDDDLLSYMAECALSP